MTGLFDPVAVPVENQPQAERKPKRRPQFWIGPVVAGSCFALGFGVTQRFLALQGGEAPTAQQTFGAQRFPGHSLRSLTTAPAETERPLIADVAAREAELAKTRPPKPKTKIDKAQQEAARLADEARQHRQSTAALRAPVVPAAAVTVLDESESIAIPELPPQAEEDQAPTEIQTLPAELPFPAQDPVAPLAVEPLDEPPVTPAAPSPEVTPAPIPVPVAVPAPAAPPAP